MGWCVYVCGCMCVYICVMCVQVCACMCIHVCIGVGVFTHNCIALACMFARVGDTRVFAVVNFYLASSATVLV